MTVPNMVNPLRMDYIKMYTLAILKAENYIIVVRGTI